MAQQFQDGSRFLKSRYNRNTNAKAVSDLLGGGLITTEITHKHNSSRLPSFTNMMSIFMGNDLPLTPKSKAAQTTLQL